MFNERVHVIYMGKSKKIAPVFMTSIVVLQDLEESWLRQRLEEVTMSSHQENEKVRLIVKEKNTTYIIIGVTTSL